MNEVKLHCGDNLEYLESLPDSHVDLIYCDILYGTGRKFKDYQDLKPKKAIIEEHYIPRITEMKRILKDTGSIYLQMDSKINHWVRCIMDDIFGYDMFLNEIVWCYNGGGVSKKYFNKKHDTIVIYTKNSKHLYNTQYQPYNEASAKRLQNKHKGEDKSERVSKGTPMTDWWTDIKCIVNPANVEYTSYNTQKPKALLERIIKASSNEGDIVADFYLGSGTTAEVCKDLNRNFIGCDINPRAIEVTRERLK